MKQLTDLGFEIWMRKQGKSWEDHFDMLLDFRRLVQNKGGCRSEMTFCSFSHRLFLAVIFRKHQHLDVPAPDTRTKVKQVLSTASVASGENSENGDVNDGESDRGSMSADTGGDTGPPNMNPATEEYKDEQAFRRWVVAQVRLLMEEVHWLPSSERYLNIFC